MLALTFKAEQEVPDWLEETAENAVGTNYGPAGGRFGSRDTRKVSVILIRSCLMKRFHF